MRYVQGLQPRNNNVRLEFSQCLLQNILVELHILCRVLRTDKAPFTRTGVMTSATIRMGNEEPLATGSSSFQQI
jgi:hypothetical protein